MGALPPPFVIVPAELSSVPSPAFTVTLVDPAIVPLLVKPGVSALWTASRSPAVGPGDYIGAYMVGSTGGWVELTYQIHGDPGGWIPAWLANQAALLSVRHTLENLGAVVHRYANVRSDFVAERE